MLEDRQLSQMFLRKGLVDEKTLEEATKLSTDRGTTLYDVLLTEGLVDEEKAIVAVSKQLNLPCVSLKEFEANAKILELVEHELATQFRLMPLGLTEEEGERKLYLAMANPLDIEAIEEVGKLSGFPVVQLLAGPNDIDRAIERSYSELGEGGGGGGDGDLNLGGMLDGLFDDKDGPSLDGGSSPGDATPSKAQEPADGLGFSLDFGDLGLSVGESKGKPKTGGDVHNKMTLPAGTEIPKDVAPGGFKRDSTAVRDKGDVEKQLAEADAADARDGDDGGSGGGGSPLDDWSDLATFGLEEEDEPETPERGAPVARTDNSTVRYVADPSLQRASDGFPHNVPASDLVRATVSLLVAKGILTEREIREEIKKLRHGARKRR